MAATIAGTAIMRVDTAGARLVAFVSPAHRLLSLIAPAHEAAAHSPIHPTPSPSVGCNTINGDRHIGLADRRLTFEGWRKRQQLALRRLTKRQDPQASNAISRLRSNVLNREEFRERPLSVSAHVVDAWHP